MQKEKTHKITLRMSKQTRNGIKKMAVENNRSINSEIVVAVAYYLASQDYTPKSPNNKKQ